MIKNLSLTFQSMIVVQPDLAVYQVPDFRCFRVAWPVTWWRSVAIVIRAFEPVIKSQSVRHNRNLDWCEFTVSARKHL